MLDIALSPEIVELVGRAALPVLETLETPTKRELVAQATWPALNELCERDDLPREIHMKACVALLASRRVIEGSAQAYGKLLGSTHALLQYAGLPAPFELAEDVSPN